MRKPRAVTVTTIGTPPLSGAAAFARMLIAAEEKRPDLRVVAGNEAKEKLWKTKVHRRGA